MSDPVENYRKALADYSSAVERLKSVGSVLLAAGLQLYGTPDGKPYQGDWRMMKVFDHPKFIWPTDFNAPAMGFDIDARKWAGILDDLVARLNAAHAARRSARALWEQVPVDHRVGEWRCPPE